MNTPTVVETRIPLRGGALAARQWGDPTLPPLLALHGWLDNAASFDALAPLLTGHHVIAIDLAGHGRSDWRAAGAWDHWVDHLGDVDQVFAHFGWPRVDLLGHSLGGALASTYAALFPERVGRLLLIEALGPLTGAVENTRAQLRKGLVGRTGLGGRGPRLFESIDEAAQARMRANGLSAAAARTLVERGLVAATGADGTHGYRWSSDPRLALPSLQRFSEAQVADVLAGLVAPTLLVLADPPQAYLAPEVLQRRIDAIASIECLHLPGNHHLHLENAAPIAAAITAFLDRHPR